jgi:hypothetical protein
VLLTVLTSAASDWNFGVAAAATTTTSTTTTTRPDLLTGQKLLLRDKPGKPAKRAVQLVAKDPAVTLGLGNDSVDDPTLHGGALRIVSRADGVTRFDTTITLPAERWQRLGKPGAGKGYRLRKAAPVTQVVVKPGKLVKVTGKGEALGVALDANPDPVSVELRLGARSYCLAFPNGTFKAGTRYRAKSAPAPAECASPSGAFLTLR